MQHKVNWAALKVEYITGNVTHAYLAAKHGVHIITLCKRAAKENWVEEKAKRRKAVVEHASSQSALQVGEELAKRNLDDLNFANDMFRVLVSRLKDCAQMDIADLGRLLESAATAQKIARLSPDASITNEVPAHAEADQMEDFDLERLSSEDIDALDQLLSKAHKNGGRVHCRPHGIDVTWQN